MYIFNRITVNPQLPKRIKRLNEVANNLWWSWNSEFLRLFKKIDMELWEKRGRSKSSNCIKRRTYHVPDATDDRKIQQVWT